MHFEKVAGLDVKLRELQAEQESLEEQWLPRRRCWGSRATAGKGDGADQISPSVSRAAPNLPIRFPRGSESPIRFPRGSESTARGVRVYFFATLQLSIGCGFCFEASEAPAVCARQLRP